VGREDESQDESTPRICKQKVSGTWSPSAKGGKKKRQIVARSRLRKNGSKGDSKGAGLRRLSKEKERAKSFETGKETRDYQNPRMGPRGCSPPHKLIERKEAQGGAGRENCQKRRITDATKNLVKPKKRGGEGKGFEFLMTSEHQKSPRQVLGKRSDLGWPSRREKEVLSMAAASGG